MSTIAQDELLAKIPLAQLESEIEQFVEPISAYSKDCDWNIILDS